MWRRKRTHLARGFREEKTCSVRTQDQAQAAALRRRSEPASGSGGGGGGGGSGGGGAEEESPAKHEPKRKKPRREKAQRPFDMDAWASREIAIWIAYDGDASRSPRGRENLHHRRERRER